MGYSNADRATSLGAQNQQERHVVPAQVADNRTSSTAQLQIQGMMHASPQSIAQRKIQGAVQQAQGRVKPTVQMKEDVPVNADVGLESEADVMGVKALGVGQLAARVLNNNSVAAVRVLQAKTDVKTNLQDATDTKTANKKINTPTQGEKWFRFAKDGNKINSFANNITTQAPAGASPVTKTVELSDAVDDASTITDMSRPQHFSLGDKLINKSADYRAGTWTWHHKIDPYKMELVDMHAHGGFYHYGGFSQWDMDDGDSDD
ncbi:MAG TPA: HNH endonuclease [Cellvibrio sp.]